MNKSIQFIGRLITAIVVLGITAFFTPGFNTSSIWIIALGIIILSGIDFLLTTFTKLFIHPIIKGIFGFILCTITLYVVQYIVAGYTVSWISAILGALVYAIVDYMLPHEQYNSSHVPQT